MPGPSTSPWEFELYVNDGNRRSEFARENLQAFCDANLNGKCRIQVIDIRKHPEFCIKNNICVTPTLIRRKPSPEKSMIGDLTNIDKMFDYLDIPRQAGGPAEKTGYREGLRKQEKSVVEHHRKKR